MSCHLVANKLPKLTILGQQPVASVTSKVTLSQFEQMSKRGQSSSRFSDKPTGFRGKGFRSDEPRGMRPPGPFRGMGPMDMPPGPPMFPPPPMGGPPIPPGPWMGPMPPPGDMGMMMHGPMPGYDMTGMRPPFGVPGAPHPDMMMMGPHQRPPGAHINPNFLHPDHRPRVNDPYSQAMGGPGTGPGGGMYGGAVSGVEFAEVMKRNHAVSSTAIARAEQDANSGDFDSAVNTLKTALSLILQSSAANSESSQALIQSLKDCLQGIEEQSEQSKNATQSPGSASGAVSPGQKTSSSASRSPTPARSRTPSPISERSPVRPRYEPYDRATLDRDKRDKIKSGRKDRETPYSRHSSSRSRGTSRRSNYDDDRRSRRR